MCGLKHDHDFQELSPKKLFYLCNKQFDALQKKREYGDRIREVELASGLYSIGLCNNWRHGKRSCYVLSSAG